MPASNPSPHASDERQAAAGPSRSDPPRLILLVTHDARRQWLRALARRIGPQYRVENASNPIDAALRLTREHAHLLVLDLAFENEQSLALIHHLARIAPSTSIVVFDESATRLPVCPYDAWPWHDAEAVLHRAIDSLQRTDPSSPPSAQQEAAT